MRDEHIIDILESAPLTRLSEDDLSAVRAHADACAACRRAYEAARVSSLLIKERVAETFEPTPFFQTRVLAALRERQAALEVPSLGRLWRAAGALVSSMAFSVVLLAALTLAGFQPAADTGARVATAADPYTAEGLLLEQADAGEEENDYGQVLSTIYGMEEDVESVNGQDR